MTKIAVIGGGIFGLEAANQLVKAGFDVTLFERNSQILSEASGNSVMRVHIGAHYPRDLETAVQSRIGYSNFVEKYYDCLDFSFKNYYALAKYESKISKRYFKSFIQTAKLDLEEESNQELKNLGFDINKVQGVWSCKEGVFDVPKLRNYFHNQFDNLGVLKLNSEITSANRDKNFWILEDILKNKYKFDYVVRTTYGLDRIKSRDCQLQNRVFEFHKTLVLEIRIALPIFGITVLDGDFITVLPRANSNTLLVYAPNPSVLQKFIGKNYPYQWDDLKFFDFELHKQSLVKRFRFWFPGIESIAVKNHLHSIRSIMPNVISTDKRTSQVREISPRFLDVWSGKMDHSISIGEQIVEKIITTRKNRVF